MNTTLNVQLMTTEEMKKYHELLTRKANKEELAKEELREIETLKKLAQLNSIKNILANLVNQNTITIDDTEKSIVNILEYENMPSVYRIQVLINNRYKTVARIKASKRDIHIAIRETTAKAMNTNYVIVNYNLPAQYHIDYKKAYEHLNRICEIHYKAQSDK